MSECLTRLIYIGGEPFVLLTAGRWTVEVRRNARAPWRYSDTIEIPAGASSTHLPYTTEGENPLIRVKAA